MNFAMLTLVLALVWAAITGNFSALNLLMGAIIGVIALWVIRNQVTSPILLNRAKKAVSLAFLFLYELILSAVRVSALVLSPNLKNKLRPGIIAFPVSAKSDVEITLLANLITLTPGTLSVDVADDRSTIFVHALDVSNKSALITEIATGFEAKIIEVFE